eukprot:1180406-Prorocentrum_minimum.AAC.2
MNTGCTGSEGCRPPTGSVGRCCYSRVYYYGVLSGFQRQRAPIHHSQLKLVRLSAPNGTVGAQVCHKKTGNYTNQHNR